MAVLVLNGSGAAPSEISGLAARAKRMPRFCRGSRHWPAFGGVVCEATSITMGTATDPRQHVVSTRPPHCRTMPCQLTTMPNSRATIRHASLSVDDVLKRLQGDPLVAPVITPHWPTLHPAYDPVCGCATAWITRYTGCYPGLLSR
jgi:hypothetical protein